MGLQVTRSRPGAWVLRTVFTPLDRGLLRLSRGRLSLAPRLVPELVLISRGRTSGKLRATPLLYLEDGGSYVVVGSNYGARRHPGWTYNLQADPRASITIRGRPADVTARRATPEEAERYWPRLVEIWPGWRTYRRLTDREFRMFVLEPA
jgi:deazaflavin-dependent oxidoreductase (nitroreductase family)